MGTIATPTTDPTIEPLDFQSALALVSAPIATPTPNATGSGNNTAGKPQNCASWDILCRLTNGYVGTTSGSGVQLPQIAPNTGTPGTSWTAPSGINLGPQIQQYLGPVLLGALAVGLVALGAYALIAPHAAPIAKDVAKVAA